MRGCLFILVVGALVLGAGAWFGSPILASSVITAALEGSGYDAASSTVTATSNPPPKLLLGRADRVEIVGTDVSFRTFHAASLDLILTDVDVVARTARHISGRIDGAELAATTANPVRADVTIDGAATAAAATITVPGEMVDRIVKATFQTKFGVALTATELVAPNTLRIGVRGITVEGRLGVDTAGTIVLSTPLGSSTILSLDPSFPLRFRSIAVDGADLRIDATLDAEALLGG
ncbi:MAG: hypothetical protein H0V73_10830 [Chloroflexi bacterium]|nr:hypothetical protein [Chloroflexota bacterium]